MAEASHQQAQFGLNQVVRMVSNAQKRPESSLTLRVKGFVLSVEPYVNKAGETSYNVKFVAPELDSIIPFYTKDLFEKGKQLELVFSLTGFNARVLPRVQVK